MTDTTHIPWSVDDPIVTVTISEPDLKSVHVFGLPFRPPADLLPLTRASFGKVMNILWGQYRQPLTVQIVETDGTRQTGVIDLETTRPPDVVSSPTVPAVLPPHASEPVDVTGTPVSVASRWAEDRTPLPVIYPTEAMKRIGGLGGGVGGVGVVGETDRQGGVGVVDVQVIGCAIVKQLLRWDQLAISLQRALSADAKGRTDHCP